ncbi:DUF5011 domain-containing protein [Schleiferilactobacillus harbinensis]|uniref:immunoglobulin-like domain-containing protein n=1 Tax=Schleiferilactobacillus harbinensis TaxID=304207 RepID=UPI0021A72CF4|nr:immunoglobulin-like domain-containing protein [Schleiferilactobacillus harbinensis]MCT2907375.1 DUF5011 domain-containing protein [Schleiferilactobacillus harbinensis]
MKKFSKVKYFGAVAAALLAVAPIAAPVVSQVASPAVAQAATADNYADALDNTFKSTANITVPSTNADLTTYLKATDNNSTASDVATQSGLGQALLKGSVDSKLSDTNLRFVFKGYETYSANQLAAQLLGGTSNTYTVTVQALNKDTATVLASKTITINIADSSKATVAGATVKVGDQISAINTPSNFAGAVSLTDRNGNTISLSGSDFNAPSSWATPTQKDNGTYVSDVKSIQFYNSKPATADGAVWSNPGQLYVVNEVLTPNSTKYATVNWATVADNSNGLVKAKDGHVYVYRPITITTGTNDQQYYPVFKYTYSKASADASAKIVSYTDGQTVDLNSTDASALHFYTAAQGTSYADISNKLIAQFTADNFSAIQDATVTSDGKPAGDLTVGYKDAFSEANVKKAIGTNLYKAGTYYIPVTVTNKANLSATVKIPVVIGYAANAPVAVSFTPYTEITKGAAFDKFAGIQFQNSASDKTVIPESSISVSGDVDTTTPGTYTLTYTVKNTQGNTSTFTRTVVVKDGALTESNADGVVYINKADGAKIYSDQATTSATDKTLDNTTAWKFHSVVKDSAGKIVAYNLGGKQYVKASEVSTSPVKAQAGVFTVNYPANSKWSIAVYNSDLKVQKLIPAKSSWATFGTKTLKDGKSYYNLGGNQWVRTDYGFWNAK